MSKLDVNVVKSHLRLSHNLEDDLITQYINWSTDTIINAVFDKHTQDIDIDSLEQDTTFQRAVILLTSYFYENRLLVNEVDMKDAPYGVLNAIQSLRANRQHFIKVDDNET